MGSSILVNYTGTYSISGNIVTLNFTDRAEFIWCRDEGFIDFEEFTEQGIYSPRDNTLVPPTLNLPFLG